MESGNISDGQISASSEWNTTHYADQCRVPTTYYADQWDATHYAHQGRLQFKADEVRGGAWSAAENDVNPWLQVDLVSNFTRVTGLATQGRDDYDWWVIEYKLLYSSYQNSNIENYKEMGQTVAKVNSPIFFIIFSYFTYTWYPVKLFRLRLWCSIRLLPWTFIIRSLRV